MGTHVARRRQHGTYSHPMLTLRGLAWLCIYITGSWHIWQKEKEDQIHSNTHHNSRAIKTSTHLAPSASTDYSLLSKGSPLTTPPPRCVSVSSPFCA